MKTCAVLLLVLALGTWGHASEPSKDKPPEKPKRGAVMSQENLPTATFAGGCFWCVESDFEKIPGVVEAISGYTGGRGENPTYEDYASKGHVEAVQVVYDPQKISYKELLDYFWRHVDPTDPGGQFVDRGPQYRSVIFYRDDEQKRQAEESKRELEKSGRFRRPLVTEILKLGKFYPAEDYHQNYYRTHGVKYKYYRWNSGRDQFLQKVWGQGKAAAANPADDLPRQPLRQPSEVHQTQ